MTDWVIRHAREDDLPAIRDIYNEAVRNTTSIWNEVEIDLANRLAWYRDRTANNNPVIVAVRDGQVGGYASYGPWRAFDGYRATRELSIYVDHRLRGQGLGATLLDALVGIASERGIHVLIGCVEAENKASIRLHEKAGFRLAGLHRQVGQKFGRWLDLACMEKLLDTRESPDH